MKINKQTLRELAWLRVGEQLDGWTVVKDKIVDHRRWTVAHEMVIKNDKDEYYSTYYEVGATESQDTRPYEYEEEEVEVYPVYPKTVEKVIYVQAKDL